LRTFARLAIAGLAAFVLLQAIRPSIPVKPATAELQAPPRIQRIFEKDCYSCHSDQRRLSWFDQVVPAYWLVRHDILTAREHLNFSTLGSKPAAAQKATLYEAVNMIQLGAMPLPQFVELHPEAKPTAEEIAALKAYLAPWTPLSNQPATAASSKTKAKIVPSSVEDEKPAALSLAAVPPEPNGLPFDPGFVNWKPISTTDRGDNNTFRFILANEIAVQAAQSRHIAPWPDGSRFAKIAWQQETGADGLVHPGKFVQVELMVKDAGRFQDTEGWNWGRWRGLDLKPYGKDEQFVSECTGCHRPVRGNDYVYTLPITQAMVPGNEIVNNIAAALPANLPYHPPAWNAITMYVDSSSRTTATLYGNDAAIQAVHARNSDAASIAAKYPAGAVLALVTWNQRDDPHWFGARIPATPFSVEFIQVAASPNATSYRRFAGAGLIEERPTSATAAQRASFILSLTPAQLP
jgi:mono/diheme cytochrome c family protein